MPVYDYVAQFVEIRFPIIEVNGVRQPADNFLKVKETLTRIGAPAYSRDDDAAKTLWQSCLLLHKRQHYYICHFKELFLLDGKAARTILTNEDLARRNAIALLLQEWGLVEIVDPARIRIPEPASIDTLKIIPYREKAEWQLKSKYEIGKSRF